MIKGGEFLLGLASQETMQAFYRSMSERIASEGVEEHVSNLFLDQSPRHLLKLESGSDFPTNQC